jgi:mycofactocin system creatininase family protein
MNSPQLSELTSPEVEAEMGQGRTTVVVPLGATEQHGSHLPISTDLILAEELASRVAAQLNAFVAPPLPYGCSEYHVGFPGTMSIEHGTLQALVGDLVSSLSRGGFKRIVFLSSHGGNFAPLEAAIAKLEPIDGVRVEALTDVAVFASLPDHAEQEHGVSKQQAGLHAGEWQTSLMLAARPETVRMDRAETGHLGEPQEVIGRVFSEGVASVAEAGVIGDPTAASAERGERYWEKVTDETLKSFESDSGGAA